MKSLLITLLLIAPTVQANEGNSPLGTGIFHERYVGDTSNLMCSISKKGVKILERSGGNQDEDWKNTIQVHYALPKGKWAEIFALLQETSNGEVTHSDYPSDEITDITTGYIDGKKHTISAHPQGKGRSVNLSRATPKLKAMVELLCTVHVPGIE